MALWMTVTSSAVVSHQKKNTPPCAKDTAETTSVEQIDLHNRQSFKSMKLETNTQVVSMRIKIGLCLIKLQQAVDAIC